MLRILHDLGVVARVDHHTDHPLSVLQGRPSQDEVVVVKIDKFLFQLVNSLPNGAKGAFKAVEQVVWGIADDVALEAAQMR